jgi:eukaryotic-like serine/threonine-protein kinase
MGIVYLVVAQGPAGFSKLLVIKEIKPEYLQDKAFLTMFMDEARLAARLNHPNIVQTLEVGVDGERLFMVMEYLEGRTLHRTIQRFASRGGFPLNAQIRVLSEALNGLHHAHGLTDFDGTELAIVHRDMSPQNVFITFDGQTKVVDFGIAKAFDSSYETRTGVLKGRVAYMAPEQACGEKVDCRADVYSMGVMLWEAIAGRRLWGKMTDIEVLTKVIKEQIPLIGDAKPDAPAELKRICDRAMARDRDARYESAGAFQKDLESYLAASDDKTSMRDVGALVTREFAEDRGKMHAFIESSLAAFRTGERRSGPLPRVEGALREWPESPVDAAGPGAAVEQRIRRAGPERGGGIGGFHGRSVAAPAQEDRDPRCERRGGGSRRDTDVHGRPRTRAATTGGARSRLPG